MCNPKISDGGISGLAKARLDQTKGGLVGVASFTKVTAVKLAKSSEKVIYSLLSTLLTATLVISASLFLYGTFYYAYMPKEVHESDVNFQFTPCTDTPAMCSFPTATIDTRRQKLMTGQPYSINMLVEVPDSPNNHAMGMFMSCIHMRTQTGETLKEVCKSNILEYRSELLRIIETFVFAPFLFIGSTTQRQWIRIQYFKEFYDDPHSAATHIDLEIRSKQVHVYSATLQVHAEFTGLRAIMYHHPWISTFFGVSSNIFILSVIILISWTKFIAPEASEPTSEEEHVETVEPEEDSPKEEEVVETIEPEAATKETIAPTETTAAPVLTSVKSAGILERLAKLLLVVPYFFLTVLGLVLVLAGIYLQVAHKESFNFFENIPTPVLLIAIGSVTFLGSFIACRGAARGSPLLLNVYSFFMLTSILAEITCVILAFVFLDDVKAGVAKYTKEAMTNYDANHAGVTATWDLLQQNVGCCGATGLGDWEATPDTCCMDVVAGCGLDEVYEKYSTGCVPALEGLLVGHKEMVGGVGLGLLLLQVIAFKLARSIVGAVKRRSQKID